MREGVVERTLFQSNKDASRVVTRPPKREREPTDSLEEDTPGKREPDEAVCLREEQAERIAQTQSTKTAVSHAIANGLKHRIPWEEVKVTLLRIDPALATNVSGLDRIKTAFTEAAATLDWRTLLGPIRRPETS